MASSILQRGSVSKHGHIMKEGKSQLLGLCHCGRQVEMGTCRNSTFEFNIGPILKKDLPGLLQNKEPEKRGINRLLKEGLIYGINPQSSIS